MRFCYMSDSLYRADPVQALTVRPMESTTEHDRQSSKGAAGQAGRLRLGQGGGTTPAGRHTSDAALAPKVGELILACWVAIDAAAELGQALRARPRDLLGVVRPGERPGSEGVSRR